MSGLPKRERVPEYHYASEQSKALIETLEDASMEAKAALEDVMAQFFINTAAWGLSLWEIALGITVAESKDIEYRRSRIKAKLRGDGVTTVALIKNVAESFANGRVEVTEYPTQFRIEIKLVDTYGIPPNIEDLTDSLSEIIPAHLAWDYIVMFNSWGSFGGWTWGELGNHTWIEAKERELIGTDG